MGNPLRRKENNTRWSSISIPLPIDTNDPRASKMDSHFPIEISDSEVEIELGTATAPVVVDESEDEAEQEEQDVEMTDDNTLREFTRFPDLPIELRLHVWNLAFPPRVVNITYDEEQKQSFSFNSSPPMLLQIHRETREIALKTYTQCFGADSSQPVKHRIWINFVRDIILPSDDYRNNTNHFDVNSGKPLNPLQNLENVQPELVQNLAISFESFEQPPLRGRTQAADALTEQFLVIFTTLKNLYVVYEDGVNPYSRGRIRFFDMERTCHASCEDKGCINLALITANCQDVIDKLRNSEAVLARGVNVQFVGAWRGGSRDGFGHALDGYEDESDDEYHNPKDDPWDGYESDCADAPEPEYDDSDNEEALFSDHKGWRDPDYIPESEHMDLREDIERYGKRIAEDPHTFREPIQGQTLDLIMRNANDYYEWRKENGGKCYPIYHPDGSYKAL